MHFIQSPHLKITGQQLAQEQCYQWANKVVEQLDQTGRHLFIQTENQILCQDPFVEQMKAAGWDLVCLSVTKVEVCILVYT